jgi:hypothetical protein
LRPEVSEAVAGFYDEIAVVGEIPGQDRPETLHVVVELAPNPFDGLPVLPAVERVLRRVFGLPRLAKGANELRVIPNRLLRGRFWFGRRSRFRVEKGRGGLRRLCVARRRRIFVFFFSSLLFSS